MAWLEGIVNDRLLFAGGRAGTLSAGQVIVVIVVTFIVGGIVVYFWGWGDA